MRAVLDQHHARLVLRMGRVSDSAQVIFEPLPVFRLGVDESLARQTGRVDADPAVAFCDEFLQRLLLVGRQVEGGFLKLHKHLVSGKIFIVDDGGIVSDIDGESVFARHLLQHRRGCRDHFEMILRARRDGQGFELWWSFLRQACASREQDQHDPREFHHRLLALSPAAHAMLWASSF